MLFIKPTVKELVASLEKMRSNQKYAQTVQTQVTFTLAIFITAEPNSRTFNSLVWFIWLGLLVLTKQTTLVHLKSSWVACK